MIGDEPIKRADVSISQTHEITQVDVSHTQWNRTTNAYSVFFRATKYIVVRVCLGDFACFLGRQLLTISISFVL